MNGKKLLVIANETMDGPLLPQAIHTRGAEEVLVVAPALNSRFRHWVSDVDEARDAAAERLAACLGSLRSLGLDARGAIGDSDPMQAIADALHSFPADEIVIATHPRGRSNWLERGLVGRARGRYAQPILHVVVETPQPVAAAA